MPRVRNRNREGMPRNGLRHSAAGERLIFVRYGRFILLNYISRRSLMAFLIPSVMFKKACSRLLQLVTGFPSRGKP